MCDSARLWRAAQLVLPHRPSAAQLRLPRVGEPASFEYAALDERLAVGLVGAQLGFDVLDPVAGADDEVVVVVGLLAQLVGVACFGA